MCDVRSVIHLVEPPHHPKSNRSASSWPWSGACVVQCGESRAEDDSDGCQLGSWSGGGTASSSTQSGGCERRGYGPTNPHRSLLRFLRNTFGSDGSWGNGVAMAYRETTKMTEKRYLSREEAQEIECPQCAAPIGVPCFPADQGRRRRPRNHATRVNLAAARLGVVLPHQRRRS